MSKNKHEKIFTADEIGEIAERGENVNHFFTGKGRMVPGLKRPAEIQRVNVDFTWEILSELDVEATRLNISRQAVIKTLVSDALDRRIRIRKIRGVSTPPQDCSKNKHELKEVVNQLEEVKSIQMHGTMKKKMRQTGT